MEVRGDNLALQQLGQPLGSLVVQNPFLIVEVALQAGDRSHFNRLGALIFVLTLPLQWIVIKWLYLLGVSPHRLTRLYSDVR